MAPESVVFTIIQVKEDGRGRSGSLPGDALHYLAAVRDVHFAEIRPGTIRGNHYHILRHEVILVWHSGSWSLHHDSGEGTEIVVDMFQGAGIVSILVPPGCAHAIRNEGRRALIIVGLGDREFVENSPDSHPRIVAEVVEC